MADFNVRSDSVNVEQIMDQIRSRIREKRGVDYTEQQIRELAAVKLEKLIDPSGVRSDLLEQFRKVRPANALPERPNYAFEESTLFDSNRGVIRFLRKLLNPILKLFFNPNPLIQALNIQSRLNRMNAEREAAQTTTEQLVYEVLHNLVVELTKASIEVKSLKMRVESLASRVEFNERRARALESVVVYRPPVPQGAPSQTPQQSGSPSAPGIQPQGGPIGEGPGQRSRRRRRRRGRRGGGSAASIMGVPGGSPGQPPGAPVQSPEAAGGQEPADSPPVPVPDPDSEAQ